MRLAVIISYIFEYEMSNMFTLLFNVEALTVDRSLNTQ